MVECPSLGLDDGIHHCSTYLHRGPNCSLFPIDERDLRDRDRVMPDRPCGYRFAPSSSGGGNGNGSSRHAFPWEIDGNALGGKVRRTNSFTMVCAFLRTIWTILRETNRNGHGNGKGCGDRAFPT